ncbi:hypothetical protein HOLDEFILI_00326 [Holdemania filiformis DSM 12042]|uniref:Uncharacterized protein n=1 Tax=Holdemania filiformis DSM 12042 TaxID=545696 RepID=B9Y3F1_9FIRM|nr:hypothetical protein HOLDEFILI_00326 [Holdemania filiformis DSM 12042]
MQPGKRLRTGVKALRSFLVIKLKGILYLEFRLLWYYEAVE